MIVLIIDSENSIIKIFDKNGITDLPINQYSKLKKILNGRNALFLESAYEVDYSDIQNMIGTGSEEEQEYHEEEQEDEYIEPEEVYYIHPKKNNSVRVSEEISFSGIEDFQPLNKFANSVEDLKVKNKVLYSLINQGILEVVTNDDVMKEIIYEASKRQEKMDRELDSIILNKSVDSFLRDSRNGITNETDVEEILVD